MNASTRSFKPLVVALVLIGGIVPPLLYAAFAVVPPEVVVEAGAARELVRTLSPMAVLVDVRTPGEYAAGHLGGAINWPASEILALKSFNEAADMALGGQPLIGRPLFLVCSSGIESTLAARHLWGLGIYDVRSVRGGMPAYVAVTPRADCPLSLVAGGAETPLAPVPGAAYRESPSYEQWASVLTGFGVKPFYMALALALAIIVWRSRWPELVALRWGLLAFFVGEAFCAVNFLVFHDDSYMTEFLHSYGMVLCFGFTTWAAFEGMDRWLIRYTDAARPCAALSLCRQCIKTRRCGLRPASAVLPADPCHDGDGVHAADGRLLRRLLQYNDPGHVL
jgi:rhodanese-related sulfurtransferase